MDRRPTSTPTASIGPFAVVGPGRPHRRAHRRASARRRRRRRRRRCRLPAPRARLDPRALHARRSGRGPERRGRSAATASGSPPAPTAPTSRSRRPGRSSSRTTSRSARTPPSIGRRWGRRGSRPAPRSTTWCRSVTASCSDATCCWPRRSASRAAPRSASHVVLGGQVGVGGHLTLGDGVKAVGQSGITNSVEPGVFVSGYPAIENIEWRKASAVFREAAGDAQAAQGARAAPRGARAATGVNACAGGHGRMVSSRLAACGLRAGVAVVAAALALERGARGGVAPAQVRLPAAAAAQRPDRDPQPGPFDADRQRAALVSRRVEGREAGPHRLRAFLRAPDVQGLEERRARAAHLDRRLGRRTGQRLHQRGHHRLLADGARPLPAAGAVDGSAIAWRRCASSRRPSSASARW